jgi:glutathione S-transferase
MSSPLTKITIWLWPTGLFPRRIIFFLRLARISRSTLSAHNITLIPVSLTPTALVSLPGTEARPPSTTLPLMRIAYPDGRTVWIRESGAILEYLDEVLCQGERRSLLGGKAEDRARQRDAMSVLSDAMMWSQVALVHSEPKSTSWSGLKAEDMSPAAAAHASEKMRALLDKLERWIREDGKEGKGLLGEVGMVDVVLMAHVEYLRDGYGVEWVQGHEGLVAWWERVRSEEWVVGKEVLGEVERTGEWGLVLEE